MRMYMRTQTKKHRNNLGFSLLELMVGVAIMAVMLGAGLTTYRIVSRTNVKKATKYIDDTLTLAREKARTISAQEWNMTIDATGDSVYVQVIRINQEENGSYTSTVMSQSRLPENIDVRIIDAYGNATYLSNKPGDMKYVSFAFTPLIGSVSKIYYDKDTTHYLDLTQGGFCDIEAYYGNKKSKSVRIYFVTGKHMEV